MGRTKSKQRTYSDTIPLDGAWATDGVHASVYCGICHRWIDALCLGEDPGAIKVRHHYAAHSSGVSA